MTSAAELDRLRGLVAVSELIQQEIARSVVACHEAGVDMSSVAFALGVYRSTVYRRYLPPGRSQAAS